MIMLRHAEDDVEVLQTANGIEKAGGEVISIASNGEATHFGALEPHTRFIVWARVKDLNHIKKVDRAIEAEQRKLLPNRK